jgi:hypothetical protein
MQIVSRALLANVRGASAALKQRANTLGGIDELD